MVMHQTALVSVQTKLASAPDYNSLCMNLRENPGCSISGMPAARDFELEEFEDGFMPY